MKKRTILLNLSLIFGAAYHALFIAGYLVHPLFGKILNYPPDTLELLKPTYFMSVIVVAAAAGVGFAVFNVLMRKNNSKGLFIGAVLFSGGSFIAERFVNFFAPSASALDRLAASDGQLGVMSFQLSRSAAIALAEFLLPLLVAAIVLMCCAYCVGGEVRENLC